MLSNFNANDNQETAYGEGFLPNYVDGIFDSDAVDKALFTMSCQ